MKSTFTERPKKPKWIFLAEADEVAKWDEEAKHAKNCAKEQILASWMSWQYLRNSSMRAVPKQSPNQILFLTNLPDETSKINIIDAVQPISRL